MRHQHETIAIVCSDRVTPITAGTNLGSFVMPWDYTMLDIQSSLTGVAASGTFEVDADDDGVSMLSTLLTIDAGEYSSLTASAGYAFDALEPGGPKSAIIAKGSLISINVTDDASGDAVGLIVYLLGFRDY